MYKAFSSGLLGFGGRSAAEDVPLAVKYGYEGIILDIAKESQGDAGAFRALLEDNNLKSGGGIRRGVGIHEALTLPKQKPRGIKNDQFR